MLNGMSGRASDPVGQRAAGQRLGEMSKADPLPNASLNDVIPQGNPARSAENDPKPDMPEADIKCFSLSQAVAKSASPN